MVNPTDQAISTSGILRAVLGPTNTGKTHYAIKEMLNYSSGVIGFPLRLLARENYDRLVKEKGSSAVALVTGEEKIIPARARYFVCTVESMPVDKSFDFLAIDEIQLCADPERGHVFTDRLLRARGNKITLFLGADHISHLLDSLIPGLQKQTRPRLSELTYTGFKKLTRLPKRSAVVAFSIDDIYRVAEMVRRHKGGAALVLGALSPRARNAQVELYQNGEVDYLVATDAIGMGLNMDIHHVAFAGRRKYDGYKPRNLTAAEIGQIAGRAGRYKRDGTFGTTLDLPEIPMDMIQHIESHEFEATRFIYWRNSNLNFSSPKALLKSLNANSSNPFLQKGRDGDDMLALQALIKRDDVITLAKNKTYLRLLWEICQVPDFRKTLDISHQEFLASIFLKLCEDKLSDDFILKHLSRLDNTNGGVDALMTRISHVRTWSYIANRSNWLENPKYWRDKAREIEDRLSDTLHQSLTRRFIDKRSSVLMRHIGDNGREMSGRLGNNGEVIVEGHLIGYFQGFNFQIADEQAGDQKSLFKSAGRKILKPEIRKKIIAMSEEKGRFTLDETGIVYWQEDKSNPLKGHRIARLGKGHNVLEPQIILDKSDLVEELEKSEIEKNLSKWTKAHINEKLANLRDFDDESAFSGAAAGIAFQLKEALGIIPRSRIRDLIDLLDDNGRKTLRDREIRLGPEHIYVRPLLKPAAIALKALLWNLYHEQSLPAQLSIQGAASFPDDKMNVSDEYALMLGYPHIGSRYIRVDMLDRLVCAIYDSSDKGVFHARHQMAEWLGCGIEDLYKVLEDLGHRKTEESQEGEEKSKPSQNESGTKNKEEKETKQVAKPELAKFKLKQFVKSQNTGKKHNKKRGKNKKEGKKGTSKAHSGKQHEALSHSPFAVLKDVKNNLKKGS